MTKRLVAKVGQYEKDGQTKGKYTEIGITRLDLSPEAMLEQAKEWATGGVIVIGYDEDGDLQFASSMADGGEVLWYLEQAKLALLTIGEDD